MLKTLIVVGAGIAGRAAAFYASRAGHQVTVIDSGGPSASTVPVALINPVRGTSATTVKEGVIGAQFTFKLVERLQAEGHGIVVTRGLWRPVPDLETKDRWDALLQQSGVAYAWHSVPETLRLSEPGPAAVLLPDSGTVESQGLLDALREASRAQWLDDEVLGIQGDPFQGFSVRCATSGVLHADRVLWCGGAWGERNAASRTFRPGQVMTSTSMLATAAWSYGLYCVPYGSGSMIGPTNEPRTSAYPHLPNESAWLGLQERVAKTVTTKAEDIERWHGVRLHGSIQKPYDTLTAFGSRGYLMAPLRASQWVESLRGSN